MASGIDLPLCPDLHWEVCEDQNAGRIRGYKWRGNAKQLLITTTSTLRSSRGHAFADVCEIVVASKQKPAQIQEIKSLSQTFEGRLTGRPSDIFRDLKCSAIAYQRPKPHRVYRNLPETILIFRLHDPGCEFFVTRTEFSRLFKKQSIDSLLVPVMLLARPLWPNGPGLRNNVDALCERLPDHPSRNVASVTRLDVPHLRAAAEKDRGLRSKSELRKTACNEQKKALSRFVKPDLVLAVPESKAQWTSNNNTLLPHTSSQMITAPTFPTAPEANTGNVCQPISLSGLTEVEATSSPKEQLDTCKHRQLDSDLYESACTRENQQCNNSRESRAYEAESARPYPTKNPPASARPRIESTNSETVTECQTKHDMQLARHGIQKVSLGGSVKLTLMSLPQEIRDMILDVALENFLDQTVALCEHTKSQHPDAVFMASQALRRQAYDRIWSSQVVIQQNIWRHSLITHGPRLRVLHKARNFRIEIDSDDSEGDDRFISWLAQIWSVEKTIHKLTVYCRPHIDSLPKIEPHISLKKKILDAASGFSCTITWDPNNFDGGTWTPLFQALTQKKEFDLDILAFILQRSNKCLNRIRPVGYTPLSMAVIWGRADAVELLVNTKGIDCNQTGLFYHTPLHWAARNGEHACARILLSQPTMQVNCLNLDGRTAVDLAIEHGHTAIADLLRAKDCLL